MAAVGTETVLILVFAIFGLLFGVFQFYCISKIKVQSGKELEEPLADSTDSATSETTKNLVTIYEAIRDGANAFLFAEYTICFYFIILFGIVVLIVTALGEDSWVFGGFSLVAFVLGACTSIASGYIGMKVAVYSNVRTTISAQKDGWAESFNCAFRAGGVMGFCLCGLGILVLYIAILGFQSYYGEDYVNLTEAISSYGLGGSSIALFGRVGGGIYTKAADVGADLVGKVNHNIPEDDPRNPATIADNVGDNVGDVAGMGADLFGSFAESTCAALVIGAESSDLRAAGLGAIVFPITISACGIIVCALASLVALHLWPVKRNEDVEKALKVQLILTTAAMLPVAAALAYAFLPPHFTILSVNGETDTSPGYAFLSIACGAVGGLIIGLVTEYFTSKTYKPVQEVANSCTTGAATNVIYGLALGYKSAIVPVIVLAIVIFVALETCDMYGVALAAVGMLSTLATGLTIDAYGPVCDNAGGIAEMAELDPYVREKTDALDAAGNTTAAIGKGFAIGSAALVSLALYGAFVTRLGITTGIDILKPLPFAFTLIGAMLPYWFSAMTMKSVGTAAMEMVREVERQFREKPELLNPKSGVKPDYDTCVQISTRASLREMIAPGCLVMLSPVVVGIFFGVYAVSGLLTGGLVSGVQLAISMSNTGGAWDNAKKLIESSDPEGPLGGKGSEVHKASVIGDTIGDPLKDTSGPSLNILMKLMAIISLVFANFFDFIFDGNGLFQIKSD
eukprot:CAMPEP_0113952886 /NCGR_PEP_ID=MMETSP1339-20121228/90672_1 /TAXON_ID=94617 /ORGANISM="Fibrocapsa japonica" /LENGTH=739 /DNA_ID=CAMNT_0000961559 /DNA_START=70 /DNA_END=2289 /DNA_ORIENTATION=+ /assembly_acc=CAM_ASM_000762